MNSNGCFRFYMECLLPELINPQYCKRILINDIKEPDHIKKQQNKKNKINLYTSYNIKASLIDVLVLIYLFIIFSKQQL